MGTEFNAAMKAYFGCHQGAYSVVTSDEYRKSQVTFVGPEKTIAEAFFGERLNHNHGNIEQIRAQGHDPEVQFRKFPTGELISLTVSYKSNRPMELRYYLRKDIFKPKAGEYWGLFVKDNAIWLFHLSEWMLNEICKGELPASSRAELLEPEIDDFQEVINQTPAAMIASTSMKWMRDPSLALKALQAKGYQCELYPQHPTFISKKSGNAFQEAHHLIPMKSQNHFPNINLDRLDNICVLSPFAHRKLHHASFDSIIGDLRKLISTRRHLLEALSIIEDDVIALYR